jgi:hypothetical protein
VNEIVAKSLSKNGGRCACGCGRTIPKLGVIYKVAAQGRTTPSGQGPGFWVGAYCAAEYPDPRGLYEPMIFMDGDRLFGDDEA